MHKIPFGSLVTGFADEISPDLGEQIWTLCRLGLQGLDLRSVGGVNVLDLSDAALTEVKMKCADAGLFVQSIGSPVNKVAYSEANRREELEKLKRALHAGSVTGAPRIRIFSPEAPSAPASAVIEWMAEQRELATRAGATLLHENDARFWGAYPENARLLFAELGNDFFRAAFDFANTVLIGFRPWDDWFPWILPYLDTLHIKDAIEVDQRVVPCGEGEGQVARTLKYLDGQGWRGPLTLEPHLAAAGPFGGFSGDRLFEVAAQALRRVVGEMEA